MTRIRPYGDDARKMSPFDHVLAILLALAMLGGLAWWSVREWFVETPAPAVVEPHSTPESSGPATSAI